jgi:hypothetical protein
MMISLLRSVIEDVIDTRCVMSLIDTRYLLISMSNIITIKMSLINVKDINEVFHECILYVILDLYLDDIFEKKKRRNHLCKKFHVVDDLRCKILIDMNILSSKQMRIDLISKSLFISTCRNLEIFIKIALKSNARIKRVVHSKDITIISSNSIVSVSIYLKNKKLLSNRDFLFELDHEALENTLDDMRELYTHVCDCNLIFVHVKNELSTAMKISLRTRLRILIEYEKKDCFQIDVSYHE